MSDDPLVQKTIDFVKTTLQGAEGGHDWFHTERVYKTAKFLAKEENTDQLVVKLAALLHDIADPKFHNGDETIGPETAKKFLKSQSTSYEVVQHVVSIIKHMSFKNSLGSNEAAFTSAELKVVQDADRLDAIGAIGIARTFNYGGFKNRELYNPDLPPNLNMTKEEYKKSYSPTINHFYEKLLLLKDKMNTETGKKLAEERHQFMLKFLDQFYKEWNSDM
ncbi:HD domain-containing protein [Flagellimonas allohymeniacidonis]|uniref:HD domain-containing protein n=1 Tax=Flagellimonas allohymeniacidonis TaxID=2517819 RepID=A0A4Q8QD24_9FLAO|nr:HD domain-containing protein [Allomuricauda hymeniacidonis]TAI47407.1 HD domain-containing protein [Allomuricauda hymeniacidonis]